MIYEWYADVFFLTNLLLDISAMLVVGIIQNQRIRLIRCILVCALGDLVTIFILLCLKLLPGSILLHGIVHPLMIWLVFGGRDRAGYLRTLLTVYVVFFLMGGIQSSMTLYFGNHTMQIVLSGLMATIFCVIYLVRRKVTAGICQVELWYREQKMILSAYCDSGNLLRDPMNGAPVSIIQKEAVVAFGDTLPEKKKITYRTISEPEGSLDVIILDRMVIYCGGTTRQILKPEIGLHSGELMQHPKVQLLLNAAYC